MSYHWLFPFDEVEKGSEIVIYGGGEVGRQFLSQILSLDYCKCLFIVDRNYKKLNKIADIEVYAPEQIQNCEYDKIVIASEVYNDEIFSLLLSLGVPDKKIARKIVIASNLEYIVAKIRREAMEQRVRTATSVDDLDAALAAWQMMMCRDAYAASEMGVKLLPLLAQTGRPLDSVLLPILKPISVRFAEQRCLLDGLAILKSRHQTGYEAIATAVARVTFPDTAASAALRMSLELVLQDEVVDLFRRYFSDFTITDLQSILHVSNVSNFAPFLQFAEDIDISSLSAFDLCKLLICARVSSESLVQRICATAQDLNPQEGFASADWREIKSGLVALPSVKRERTRLRIALCVSGQLRGYQAAYPSWTCMGLDRHETTTVVHTWRYNSDSLPVGFSNIERCFAGNFLEAFKAVQTQLSNEEIYCRYPTLCAYFMTRERVTETALQEFYKTEHVFIEDDTQAPVSDWNNFEKMYYKIAAAQQEALKLGDYDLIIRIRPDKMLNGKFDWQRLLAAPKTIWVDMPLLFYNQIGLVVGDQFGAGSPEVMEVYASAVTLRKNLDLSPKQYMPHINLAYAMLYGGVRTCRPDSVLFGELVGVRKLMGAELLRRISVDAIRGDPIDMMLLEAALADQNRTIR